MAGSALLLAMLLVAFLGSLAAPFDPESVGVGATSAGPDAVHWFGTDELGRDVLSRVLSGAQISFMVGIVAALASTVVGVVVGGVSGYAGGLFDEVTGRITDMFMVIPRFFLAIIVVALFGATVGNIIFSISVLSWPTTARLVRGEFLTLKSRQFVDASKLLGVGTARLIFEEILPNAMGPIIVNSTLLVAQAMLLEAGLSYLGLGDPNVISWGQMLFDAQAQLQHAWWEAVFPGSGIFIAVLSLNLVGDGLADALNPRLREL